MDQKYFATLPTDEIGSKLCEKAEEYYRFVQSNGYYLLWRDCHRTFYNGFFSKGEILAQGKQGEKRKISMNHFRNILEHIKVLTTEQRPVFEPKAINSDYKSASQVHLARGLLDYYMRQENLEEVIDGCMDFALQAGEGYIFQEWDKDAGDPVGEMDIETGEEEETEEEVDVSEEKEETSEDLKPTETLVKREGNIKSYSFHPIDVIRDFFKDTTENNQWYIIRRRVNKWELAAKYPKFTDEITSSEIDSTNVTLIAIDDYDFKRYGESDQTYVFTFRHAKTAAVPDGRQVEFLPDGTILYDSDLPYNDISIYMMMPNRRENSNFGYTVAFDMLAVQKAIDMLDSTIVTNQSTFGVQNVLTQKGSNLTTAQLTGGLNKLEFSGDFEPKALQLTNTAPEIFSYKKELVGDMETISGVNSVTRGNPEASLRSGSALALVQSMTIQFNSGFQHSYVMALEKVGSGTISMLKDYAHAPRMALIAGISKRSYLKEFSNKDLENIDRVIIEVGNPLSKTIAGKQQMADMLAERGLIENPDQFLQVLETGRIDPLVEGKYAEIMNIRSENENLTMGEDVSAIYTDNHWLHVKEHKNVLQSPDARKETDIIVKTQGHINEHIQLLRSTDPGILMILGQQPIPSPMNAMGGPMEAPAVPGQPEPETPQQGQIGTPPPGGPEAGPSGEGGTGPGGPPKMPNMPKNAMTGEEFNTTTGGL